MLRNHSCRVKELSTAKISDQIVGVENNVKRLQEHTSSFMTMKVVSMTIHTVAMRTKRGRDWPKMITTITMVKMKTWVLTATKIGRGDNSRMNIVTK